MLPLDRNSIIESINKTKKNVKIMQTVCICGMVIVTLVGSLAIYKYTKMRTVPVVAASRAHYAQASDSRIEIYTFINPTTLEHHYVKSWYITDDRVHFTTEDGIKGSWPSGDTNWYEGRLTLAQMSNYGVYYDESFDAEE